LLKFTELSDFTLGLVNGSWSGQRLRDALAAYLVRESQVGTMAWLARLMAAARWLATSAGGARNGPSAKIAELGHLLDDILTALLEIGKGKGHAMGLHSERIIYARKLDFKKEIRQKKSWVDSGSGSLASE
jgi:hypothetical protein